MKKIFILFIVCAIFLCGASYVAQAQSAGLLPSDISVSLNPSNPGASQSVTATADSFSADLNSADIAWIVNGKTMASGTGLKTFSFTTGPVNTTTSLEIDVTTPDGQTASKTFNLKASDVDLIWEADGYVPPFYKGKTLFSHQDQIKFVAIPHITGSNGAEIPASNLIYTWTRNGTVLGDYSGYGKSTYAMIASIISRPLQIDVEVTTLDSSDVADASVTVAPIDPSVVFYENNPLYGIQFQKALTGDVTMTGTNEMDVLAQPFFFDLGSLSNGSLAFKWDINNSPIDSDTTQMSRVFRQKEGTSGTSYISLSIDNSDKILQSSSGGFNLQFNSANQ